MSDVIPFPKPSRPIEDDTAELLRLLERIQDAAARSGNRNDKDRKAQET
jgi:hypothetical protein